MKLSTRIRYGTRALVCIAALSKGRPIPLTEIAKRENISQKYLESIISSLKSAGLVESIRGSQGGYIVKKDFDIITLGEIVEALGGPISIINCLGESSTCSIKNECGLFDFWKELNEVIEDKLNSIKLIEIVEKKQSKSEQPSSCMYYI